MAALRTQADLTQELIRLGCTVDRPAPRNDRDHAPKRVLVRLRGEVVATVMARPTPQYMQMVLARVHRVLREQGLDSDHAVDRHAHLARASHQVDDVLPEGYTEMVSPSALRKAALVDSLGRPRAERVRMFKQYREVFRERYGIYPSLPPLGGERPVLGRCPDCEQPEDLDCLTICHLIDPLNATEPPPTPPRRAPRPWSRNGRHQ